MMLKQKLELGSPGHKILFYRDTNHKRQVLFNFLKDGLDRDGGVLYVAGDESPQVILREMHNSGFETEALEKDGRLKVVNYDRWYIIDGKVRIQNIMRLWELMLEQALERGLKGLHVCGEVSCFFRHDLVEELIKYEKKCGKNLAVPINAVCAYSLDDAKFLKAEFLFDLVRSHTCVFSPRFAGLFDFDMFYRGVLAEWLRETVGKTYAKKILSFFNKWGSILEADLGEGSESFHSELKDLIGARADQIEERVLLDLCERFDLEIPYFL